jgi:hypothetical protein
LAGKSEPDPSFIAAAANWTEGLNSKDYPNYDKFIGGLSKETFDTRVEKGAAWVGAPETIARQIRDYQQMVGSFEIASMQLRWFRNWRAVWRYRASPWDLPSLHLRRGFTLHHRPNDLALMQIAEVMAGKCYRRCMKEPRSGTVIDIGANIGVVTLDWATRLEGVRVHAYEPHPETYAVPGGKHRRESALAANFDISGGGGQMRRYDGAA